MIQNLAMPEGSSIMDNFAYLAFKKGMMESSEDFNLIVEDTLSLEHIKELRLNRSNAPALLAKSRACDRLQPVQGALAPQGFSGRL